MLFDAALFMMMRECCMMMVMMMVMVVVIMIVMNTIWETDEHEESSGHCHDYYPDCVDPMH